MDKRISDLEQVQSLSNTDVFPVVNGGITKKVTLNQLVSAVPPTETPSLREVCNVGNVTEYITAEYQLNVQPPNASDYISSLDYLLITNLPSGDQSFIGMLNLRSKSTGGGFLAQIRPTFLSADRLYTLPNKDGTFAMTSDLPLVDAIPTDASTNAVSSNGVFDALANKVDKVAGKGLSTNDYTTTEQTKLAGIQAGAEVNVNADWNATSGDAQILNKPLIPVSITSTNQLINNGSDGVNPFITALDIPTTGQASTLVREVKNMTGATLTKGTVVYISGANGNKALVSKALATTDELSSRTFGLLQSDILNNGLGFCVIIGDLTGVDTSSFAEGAQLYLSGVTAGTYTDAKILAPTHLVYVGKVTRSHPTLGQIEVGIQNGYELEEIHDVAISNPLDNQVLTYDGTTGLWKNEAPSGGITLTTFGSNGAATLVGNTLNIPVYDVVATIPLKGSETFRGINYQNNSTNETLGGGIIPSTSASTIARNVSSSSYINKQIRKGFYASVVSSGRYIGTRGSALLWYVQGGFKFVCDFGITDTAFASGCRQFYGMAGYTSDLPYNEVVLVESLLNTIGIGSDALDTNLQIFHNDGTGAATKIDLGVDFPANRTAGAAMTNMYSVAIYNAPNSASIIYEVKNKETGSFSSGTISTNLPLHTQGLNFFASRCMGGGGGITGSGQFDLSILGVYSL